MTIDQLKYFFEVARCQNFSKAARNMYISQPNLTKQISKLEQELGVDLFERSTHHCQLTGEGHLFYRKMEDVFFRLNSNIEDTKMRGRNRYRTFTIGIAPAELPVAPVMETLRELNGSNRPVRYLLQQDTYVQLIEKLIGHEYDMIITTDRNARDCPELKYMMLSPFELVLAVHNSNPKAGRPDLRPEDCADEITFLSIPEGKNAPINRIEEFSRKTGGELSLMILPSPADIMNNIQAGAGVGLVPNTVDQSIYPDVSFFQFERRDRPSGQALLWRKNESSANVIGFVKAVEQRIRPAGAGAPGSGSDGSA